MTTKTKKGQTGSIPPIPTRWPSFGGAGGGPGVLGESPVFGEGAPFPGELPWPDSPPGGWSGAGAAAGASGAGSGFGGIFGPSVAGSIDAGLLSGAGGLGITSPASAGSMAGGLGSVLGAAAPFASVLAMALGSQFAAGQHENAIKQRAIAQQQAWEQQNPGQYLFGPNIRLDFGRRGYSTQLANEDVWRANVAQGTSEFDQQVAMLKSLPISEEDKLQRLQAWEAANMPRLNQMSQFNTPAGWDQNSVAARMHRGDFPAYNPESGDGRLYALVDQILSALPGGRQWRMNQPGFNPIGGLGRG